jgi:CRISPR-associated endonuclease/helicase Cas3
MTAACYAHSLPGRPTEGWEPLREHLERVAELAAGFAGRFGADEWGRVAGLWHDVGKYRPEFQLRLFDATIHAPHAGLGAALAARSDPQRGQLLAFAIAGHHAGLANARDSSGGDGGGSGGPTPLKEVLAEYGELLETVLPLVDESIRGAAVPKLPEWLEQSVRAADAASGTRSLAFFTRMVFSALVDADRLATAD